jgi:type I restriction enzyme S subunit
MSEWKETKLQKIVAIQNGCAFKSEDFDTQGVPVIKIKNIASGKMIWDDIQFYSKSLTGLDKFIIRYNDILISMTGSHVTQISSAVGKVTRYSSINQSLLNQRVGKIYSLNSNHLNNDFLYYFLIQPTIQYQLGLSASGSANQANISPSNIKELSILLPSLSEQKQIADVLSCLDAKIENLSRQNETLEQISRSLFKHWFIDFEFPDANGNPYKSSGGAMFASAIGDIPEGWKVGKLGDIVEVFMGYPFKSELYSFNSGIKVVRGENVSLGFLRWDTEKRWEYDLDSYTDYFLSANDYVIGMDGSRVGRNRTIILDSDLPLILAQRVARLRTKDKHTQGYINILLMNNRFEKYVDFIKTGTSIPHISGQQIKDFECIIPLKKQIEEFSGFYNAWSQKLSVIRQQIQTLTKTRDSLLPKLMSGQLRVKE